MPQEIIVALGQQKKAAVMANHSLGLISKKLSSAIIKACDQVINLNLIDEFPLSVWQTGSGTQTNMNANEVISNYAIKILRGKIGSKFPIHPNDHVNLSQSSNDTFPTVMHIAANELTEMKLLPAIKNLIKELKIKTKLYSKIIKIGSEKIPSELIIALGQQKKAAAEANIELGFIDKKLGLLISKACDDIINLKLINEFPLSIWQTG